MRELDRLIACVEDGQTLVSAKTKEDLRTFFNTSKTNIANAFEGGADGVLSRCDDDVEAVREYLLWDYIAYNINELYNSHDLARKTLEEGLSKTPKA